jgi:hypothetical protein
MDDHDATLIALREAYIPADGIIAKMRVILTAWLQETAWCQSIIRSWNCASLVCVPYKIICLIRMNAAHLSQDEAILRIINSGGDLFTMMAAEQEQIPLSQVDYFQRKKVATSK